MVFSQVHLRTVREAFPPSCTRFTKRLSPQLKIPLFKKGDRQNPANYRPVSLTSILCNILEHFINHHLITHFEENDIFYDIQHGFRKQRGCDTQLLRLIDEPISALDERKQIDHGFL